MLTIEQARERHLMGWNIACQVCGSFGATWTDAQPDRAVQNFNSLRLCPEHKQAWHALWKEFLAAKRGFTEKRFSEDGRERHPCL